MHTRHKDRARVIETAKRSITGVAGAAALLLSLLCIAVPAFGADYRIVVNDIELPMVEGPEMTALELFMPLEESVLETLDAELTPVICDGDCFVVRAYGAELRFETGNATMLVDGFRNINIPAPYREGDYYYVPAAPFFEALNFDTVWNEGEGLLTAGYQVRFSSAQDRLADLLGLASPEELERESRAAAGVEEVSEYYLDYTYDDTVKTLVTRTGGDKSQSRTKEKGDYYNQLNVRYQGYMRNGYDFTGLLRTVQTTEPDLKKGEIKKLQLGWSKGSKKLDLYDITPKFSTRYMMRNYPLEGISYERETSVVDWQFTFGKAPKELRRSLYSRYVSAVRMKKVAKGRPDTVLGATWAMVRDTGHYMGKLAKRNYVTGIDFSTKFGNSLSLYAETANSYMKERGGDTSRGAAVQYKMKFSTNSLSGVATYERTGNSFYSETSAFTRGRRDMVVNLTKKFSRTTVFTAGARSKKIKDRSTQFYPLYYSVRPLGGRDSFNIVIKRDFEKTTGGSERIVEKKALELRDVMGDARVEAKFNRQKNKTPGSTLYYREQKTFAVKKPLTDRLDTDISHKRERWKGDRSSAARQTWVKMSFEPKAWTEFSLNLGRYYNTPKNARTTTRLAYQKIDIFNDREWKFEYKFENYRDYNVNSFSLLYSFYR